jgi:DNA-binding MltR family transcriptional regulator
MNESEEPSETPLTTQMLRRESDRGCVLVGAAILEEGLDALLTAGFVEEKIVAKASIGPLFAAGGPLGSFWAKIQLAHALGLLSSDTHHDLESVRRLRNRFAHYRESVSFSDADVIAAVDRLSTIATVWRQVPRYSAPQESSEPRNETKTLEPGYYLAHKAGFACAVVILNSILRATASLVARKRKEDGGVFLQERAAIEKVMRDGPLSGRREGMTDSGTEGV